MGKKAWMMLSFWEIFLKRRLLLWRYGLGFFLIGGVFSGVLSIRHLSDPRSFSTVPFCSALSSPSISVAYIKKHKPLFISQAHVISVGSLTGEMQKFSGEKGDVDNIPVECGDFRAGDHTVSYTVTKGLEKDLLRLGLPQQDVRGAMKVLLQKRSWGSLRGKKIKVSYHCSQGKKTLSSLSLPLGLSYEEKILRQNTGGYGYKKIPCEVKTRYMRIQGVVATTLAKELQRQKISQPLVRAVLAALPSCGIHGRFDVRKGDKFSFLCKEMYNPVTQERSLDGVILAKISSKAGGTRTAYLYKPKGEKRASFYNEHGHLSLQKKEGGASVAPGAKFCRPLIRGTISSKFGYRRHPIYCRTKLHTGVDYAAPAGTPVVAASAGVVDRVQWFGGYGRYVRIRHGAGYHTAYAHLSRYANALRPGQRVVQGQIIGYVGASGVTSGPHLHFEVLHQHRPVDPLRFSSNSAPSTPSLPIIKGVPVLVGSQKDAFIAYIRHLQKVYESAQVL